MNNLGLDHFRELDRFLQADYDDDYWCDLGFEEAERLIGAFEAPDWPQLEKAWPIRGALWLGRLLTALPAADREHAVPLFRKILAACPDSVLPSAIPALGRLDDAALRGSLDETGLARLSGFDQPYPHRDRVEEILVRYARPIAVNAVTPEPADSA